MTPHSLPQSVFVPIVGGDISEATFAHAQSALSSSHARLALVHVVSEHPAHGVPTDLASPAAVGIPRWCQLAAGVPTERLFVDAVQGDPAEVILAQARRFGSDVIVLSAPSPVVMPGDPGASDACPTAAERTAAHVPAMSRPARRLYANPNRTRPRTAVPRRARRGVR